MVHSRVNKSISIYGSKAHNSYRFRLICFPHAGGSASFFRYWGHSLAEAEICSIKYPGRAERINDSLALNLVTMSKEIAQDIISLSNLPTVFFGHSMGAIVALEVAKALENNNIYIEYLFASGSKNGDSPEYFEHIEENDDEITQGLLAMGGTNLETINDPLFQDLLLPAIKADSKMFHSYRMDNTTKLNCPIITICGTDDIHADIRPWHQLTTKTHTEYMVPGGHFYLIDSPPLSLVSTICKAIK